MNEDWQKPNISCANHLLKVREEFEPISIENPNTNALRPKIEAWLTALF